jgi:hypothetical protein
VDTIRAIAVGRERVSGTRHIHDASVSAGPATPANGHRESRTVADGQ